MPAAIKFNEDQVKEIINKYQHGLSTVKLEDVIFLIMD